MRCPGLRRVVVASLSSFGVPTGVIRGGADQLKTLSILYNGLWQLLELKSWIAGRKLITSLIV